MVTAVIRHKVADFATWKQGFDETTPMRRDQGERSARVYQMLDDPNNVVVILEFINRDRLNSFLGSEELKQFMSSCGVLEPPNVYYLQQAD